jgi:hypothetical protein
VRPLDVKFPGNILYTGLVGVEDTPMTDDLIIFSDFSLNKYQYQHPYWVANFWLLTTHLLLLRCNVLPITRCNGADASAQVERAGAMLVK